MTLRLADAILLGDSLKTGTSSLFLTGDGKCGCAFGGALLAAGVNAEKFSEEFYMKAEGYDSIAELDTVKHLWPWLTGDHLEQISRMYIRLRRDGDMTIEQIAAYADSIDPTPRIEPPVQEPSQVEVRQESTVSHG